MPKKELPNLTVPRSAFRKMPVAKTRKLAGTYTREVRVKDTRNSRWLVFNNRTHPKGAVAKVVNG